MSFKRKFVLGAMLLSIIFVSQSCNHFVQATAPDFDFSTSAPEYFPLNEGFSTTYEINNSNGPTESISYKVGRQISFHTGIATEWISNRNGVKDTSYFVQTSSSLIFYESKKAKPEVILINPLTAGKSWSRFDVSDNGVVDTNSIINPQDKPNDTTGGGINLVSFPTDGSDQMMVDKIESVELDRIGYFSKVVRVSNDAGGGAKNYYWYAEGVGMIKYVLGATNFNDPHGSVEGELIYYGYSN